MSRPTRARPLPFLTARGLAARALTMAAAYRRDWQWTSARTGRVTHLNPDDMAHVRARVAEARRLRTAGADA